MAEQELKGYDNALEELLIISLLKSPANIKDYLLGSTREDLFYSFWWKEVYVRVKSLTKERNQSPNEIDILHDPVIAQTTKQAITASQVFLQSTYIRDIDACKSTIHRLTEYLKIRKLFKVHEQLGEALVKSQIDLTKVTQDASQKLGEINTNTEDFVSSILNDSTDPLIDKILSERTNIYIPTGFERFDKVNKGLPRGGLTLVAATTGGGKSLMALHMARAQAEAGLRVCLVSLEMDEFELLERRVSSVTKLSLTQLKNHENLSIQVKAQAKQTFADYRERIKRAGGTEDYKCRMNNLTIDELLYGLKAFNYDVIIIDYLGLLKGVDGDDQWRKLSEAARFCKMFAADNNIQIIALAQLDKEGEVRYSKGMLEHANNSFSWVCGKKERERGIIEVEQKKARMAEAFSFYLRLEFATMSVKDVSAEEQDQFLNATASGDASKDKPYKSKRANFFGD